MDFVMWFTPWWERYKYWKISRLEKHIAECQRRAEEFEKKAKALEWAARELRGSD